MKIKGDIIELEILDIGHKGEAIGKYEGMTVFVEGGAIIGDWVRAEVIKSKSNYMVTNLKEIIVESEIRINSPCAYSNDCGGCQIIQMKYEEQLKMKERQVENTIKRISKVTDFKIFDIQGMKDPFYYRNKGQIPVGILGDKVQIGFYKTRTHEIVDIDKCIIQDKYNEIIIKIFRTYLDKFPKEIYDEQSKKGNIRRIITKIGVMTNEIMIIIVTNKDYIMHEKYLVDLILEKLPNVRTIVQNINMTINNNVMGTENKNIYGDGIIEDYLENLIFEISPLSFFQINPIQTLAMYNTALDFADINESSVVIDLYCGLGSVSLFFARKVKMVYGVEIVKEAIEDANRNAKKNNMSNKVKFICGKSEEELPRLYNEGIRADVIVLDPPRKGCEESVLETISSMGCKKIVYISCNIATLARDIGILNKLEYKLEKVKPIDNFCHSMHVETVVLMSKVK